jgi:hypothetical protein
MPETEAQLGPPSRAGAQIDLFCMASGIVKGNRRAAPNGGYLRAGTDGR